MERLPDSAHFAGWAQTVHESRKISRICQELVFYIFGDSSVAYDGKERREFIRMAGKWEEQLKEITERLEQGVKDLFTSEKYIEYLKTMSQFHNYTLIREA